MLVNETGKTQINETCVGSSSLKKKGIMYPLMLSKAPP